MRRIVAGVVAVAVLFAFTPAVMPEEKPAAKPGEPVNGLKLTISADRTNLWLTPIEYDRSTKDSPRYRVETPAKLTFTFTNVSDKPVKLDAYDLMWSRFTLEVTGPDGDSVKTLPYGKAREMAAPAEKDYPVIAPGGTWTCPYTCEFPGVFGSQVYHLMKPGEYRVKVVYRNEARPPRGPQPAFVEGAWVGGVTSNELVFKAVLDERRAVAHLAPNARVFAAPAPAVPEAPPLKLVLSADKTELKMGPMRPATAVMEGDPGFDVEKAKLTPTFTNISEKPVKLDAFRPKIPRDRHAVKEPDGRRGGTAGLPSRVFRRARRPRLASKPCHPDSPNR